MVIVTLGDIIGIILFFVVIGYIVHINAKPAIEEYKRDRQIQAEKERARIKKEEEIRAKKEKELETFFEEHKEEFDKHSKKLTLAYVIPLTIWIIFLAVWLIIMVVRGNL